MHDSGSNIFKNGLIFRSFSIQISQQNPIIVWKTGSYGLNKLKTDQKSRDTVSQDWTQKIVVFFGKYEVCLIQNQKMQFAGKPCIVER